MNKSISKKIGNRKTPTKGKTLLITQAKLNKFDREKVASMKKEKVREDLIMIWKNLSKAGRRRLMEKKMDENELFNQTEKTLKKLMNKFKLRDTVLFEQKYFQPTRSIPLDSKKTISFLKRQFGNNARKKIQSAKKTKSMKNYHKLKHQRLKALKQGNRVRHRTTHEHQLNMLLQANYNKEIFNQRPTFFGEMMKKATTNLGVGTEPGESLENTGIYHIGQEKMVFTHNNFGTAYINPVVHKNFFQKVNNSDALNLPRLKKSKHGDLFRSASKRKMSKSMGKSMRFGRGSVKSVKRRIKRKDADFYPYSLFEKIMKK